MGNGEAGTKTGGITTGRTFEQTVYCEEVRTDGDDDHGESEG